MPRGVGAHDLGHRGPPIARPDDGHFAWDLFLASAEHALSLLTDNPVEAALLDFSLGSDGNSVPVARQLRDAGIPFCYLSGHATLDAGTGAPDAPLLSKPVSMAALEDALARMA